MQTEQTQLASQSRHAGKLLALWIAHGTSTTLLNTMISNASKNYQHQSYLLSPPSVGFTEFNTSTSFLIAFFKLLEKNPLTLSSLPSWSYTSLSYYLLTELLNNCHTAREGLWQQVETTEVKSETENRIEQANQAIKFFTRPENCTLKNLNNIISSMQETANSSHLTQ